MSQPTIVVFDSGLGGLTVYREIAAARPGAQLIYIADDAGFPYGALTEAELAGRILPLMDRIIARYAPDLVVIACNTASTLVLPQLRARFAVPFVGTVPAIKPACLGSGSKLISVLGTEATVRREYTRKLIADFAGACEVTLVGSARLAAFAEAELKGTPAPDEAIRAEIEPCFVEAHGRRTDTVVLACTHYPLLLARLIPLAPWPVKFLDPAAAIARRVADLLGPALAHPAGRRPEIVFTSGVQPSGALARAIAGFGFADAIDTPALSA